MLAVLGVEVDISANSNEYIAIDAFDYHLYQGLHIERHLETDPSLLINRLNRLTDKLLSHNHLQRSQVRLLVCCGNREVPLQGFAGTFLTESYFSLLTDAISFSCSVSGAQNKPCLVLSIDRGHAACAAILVAPEDVRQNALSQLGLCHCYGYINAQSAMHCVPDLTTINHTIDQHISDFMASSSVDVAQLESIIINQTISSIAVEEHAQHWLQLSSHEKHTSSVDKKSTLLTSIDCYESDDHHFVGLLSLISTVLCVDQQYRLGCDERLVPSVEHNSALLQSWERSPYYLLSNSTSYLPRKHKQIRQLLVSIGTELTHQLLLVSNIAKDNRQHTVLLEPHYENGFLAQQQVKPFIFKASSTSELIAALTQFKQFVDATKCSFKAFSIKQLVNYDRSVDKDQNAVYCVVLLAGSFTQLIAQLDLACTGLPAAITKNQVWKTPLGSYCSGQLIDMTDSNKPLSFVYPGVGALYVNMGKDLLRLFPDSHQTLSEMSPDLSNSLQDTLLTPRHVYFDHDVNLRDQKNLKQSLANVAEAGVSYAYLLTHIFQCGLSLTATSAAGYSMGEVSMFAAMGCWSNPHLLSERLRNSPIFTEQLAGALKRLDSEWGEAEDGQVNQWESYHIKAGLLQVKSIITDYPRVFITIQNTADSLVIAGEPAQCLALAEQLGVRPIALNIPNIIHCVLSRNEYQRMQSMYSLEVQQKVACQLFSTSCYLPVPITEKAIAVSISKCLTEFVDFPRLMKNIYATGERVFVEMGAGKSLSSWIERILKTHHSAVTCLSVNQRNLDDYSAILKVVASLLSLGYPVNLTPFYQGTLVRPVNKVAESKLVS